MFQHQHKRMHRIVPQIRRRIQKALQIDRRKVDQAKHPHHGQINIERRKDPKEPPRIEPPHADSSICIQLI